ncbi:MAG TPA: glycosyl transferase family protein [Bryobacteraceae bacterium]
MLGDAIGIAVFVTQLLLVVCGVLFFISGLDDAFIDCIYVVWRLWSRLISKEQATRLSEEQLVEAEEQPIAIMVPAWDESAVIRPMLTNMLRTIEYKNHHIFVGTYPNDSATQSEVEKVTRAFPIVHRIVCPNPGPTCKADCLNAVYQGILLFERERKIEFSIFLMEDCEDLVHPLSLKLFNRLLPQNDMVQLPVFPLEREWHKFTCGHYIDEFSEYHGKDIFVRRLLTGSIPAAGVGCGFSRRAIEAMARQNSNEVFNTSSLTEDYEFGLRLGALGLKSLFVSQLMLGVRAKRDIWTPRGRPDQRIAIREYFPSSFWAAVKQKSRWVLGIAIQGWTNLGWKGTFAARYMLFRDRKAIVTNEICLLGYFIVIVVLIFEIYSWLVPDSYRYPPLVEKNSWLWNVLIVNFLFLLNRLAWRSYSVYKVYGLKQSQLAIFRQVWSNVINGCATSRAMYLYARAIFLKKKIAWDKTAHVLPTQVVLAGSPRRIGDLLVENGAVSVRQLQEALSIQEGFAAPIGVILLSLGGVDEWRFIQVLAGQLGLPYRRIDPSETASEVLQAISWRCATQFSIYPLEFLPNRRLLVATADPLASEELKEIEAEAGRKPEFCLTPRADLGLAIRYCYSRRERRSATADSPDEIAEEELARLLELGSYRRLGDILLEQRCIDFKRLREAARQFAAIDGALFGEFLVEAGFITRGDLEWAVERQRLACRPCEMLAAAAGKK